MSPSYRTRPGRVAGQPADAAAAVWAITLAAAAAAAAGRAGLGALLTAAFLLQATPSV